jgi:hypothetical protein
VSLRYLKERPYINNRFGRTRQQSKIAIVVCLPLEGGVEQGETEGVFNNNQQKGYRTFLLDSPHTRIWIGKI